MADEIREQAMNAAIKEAYLRQHGALRGGKQYSIDEQYQLIFQRGAEYGHAALAAARSEWKAIETVGDLPTETGIVYQWISYFDDIENEPKVSIANYNTIDGFWYWKETGNRVGWDVLAYQLYTEPQPYQRPSREGE